MRFPVTPCIGSSNHGQKRWAGPLVDPTQQLSPGRRKGFLHIRSPRQSSSCVATGLLELTGEMPEACSRGRGELYLPQQLATQIESDTKLWLKLKQRELFLSRASNNQRTLRLTPLPSWEQSLVPLFTGQCLRCWEVSALLGLETSAATTRKSIIQKLIWQDSIYLVHCVFVWRGHQNCNEDQASCSGIFFSSTLNTAWLSKWPVLAGVSPAGKVSWLEKLQPSESGRRETDTGSPSRFHCPKKCHAVK